MLVVFVRVFFLFFFFFLLLSKYHSPDLQTCVIFHKQHPICCETCFSGTYPSLSSSAPSSYLCFSPRVPHCSFRARPNGGICSLHLWVCWRSPEHRQLSSQKDESVECENWKMMKMLLLFRDVISICSRSRLCNSVCKKKPKPAQVGKLRWKLWGGKKRI